MFAHSFATGIASQPRRCHTERYIGAERDVVLCGWELMTGISTTVSVATMLVADRTDS